jgi:hypothetical protein
VYIYMYIPAIGQSDYSIDLVQLWYNLSVNRRQVHKINVTPLPPTTFRSGPSVRNDSNIVIIIVIAVGFGISRCVGVGLVHCQY